ncbi:cupin domain-containing protein (plasmid) [Halorussus salilacus]|uniref:cupin domain-containing protein n=1 Tax=Halorussus salilacus TaxID=2953750 RepID=UPI00209CB6C9|nr:cupin domain-containing protein [Halorussus salilacus]USZ69945.1 cupin domain-containing protein [Halorussus salilacus]
MYEKTSLDDLEPRDVEGIEPRLRAVGYQLRPDEMRPSVWEFETGETNNWHRHEAQEELYYVTDGEFVMTVQGGDEEETFDLRAGDFVVVPPETWRQLEALSDGRVFVVGAPSEKDDAITEQE